MMTKNSELLALLHEWFGIGNNDCPVNNDEVIAVGIVIQMEEKDGEC